MNKYHCIFNKHGILKYQEGDRPKYLEDLILSLDIQKTNQTREIQENIMTCKLEDNIFYLTIQPKHVQETEKKKKKQKQKVTKQRKWEEEAVYDPSLDFSDNPTMTFKEEEYVEPIKKSYKFNLFSKGIKKEDLKQKMTNHLVSKNVSIEVTTGIVNNVLKNSKDYIVEAEFKTTMKNVIRRMIHSVDHDDIIDKIKKSKSIFSICFVGVNGVGKSTSLAKICCWLLQNNFKVYIAACDTFRAGAIEQLQVHVNNFKRGGHDVGFYSTGYNKDDANVARNAINIAQKEGYDVILIDTAGRMHNKKNLMESLSKIVRVNDLDHIIFVGEALVGNDSLDHLKEFNKAIKAGRNQKSIDSLFVSKVDTVDDKVGQILNMCVSGECPVLFLGTGQTNMSLSKIDVDTIVDSLMQ